MIENISSWMAALPLGAFLLAPFLISFALSLVFFFKKSKRGYLFFFIELHILFFLVYVLYFSGRELLFWEGVSLLSSLPFLFLGRGSLKKREKREKVDPVESLTKEFLSEEIAMPPKENERKKILVSGGNMASGEDVYSLEKENISLSYVIAVATKLKRANLNVSDRLETDGIYRTLSLYRAKNELTKEELSSLGGYLSTLLKLTSKYSL